MGAVAIFGSATETFARKNLNRSIAESVEMFAPVVQRARESGLWVRAYVSMCFGDPWEGPVPIEQVVDVAQRLMDLGCDQLSLGDTIGVGTTGHVSRLLERLDDRGHRRGPDRRALPRHLRPGAGQHDDRPAPRGHRRRRLDRRAGRLPLRQERDRATSRPRTSCGPSTGRASQTGVDLEALVETSVWMAGQLGRPSPVARGAGPGGHPRLGGLTRRSRGGSTACAARRRRCRGRARPRRGRGRTAGARRPRRRRSSRSRPPGGRRRRRAAPRASWSGRCSAGRGRVGSARCARWYAADSSPARSAATRAWATSSSTVCTVGRHGRRWRGEARCWPVAGTRMPPSADSAAGA